MADNNQIEYNSLKYDIKDLEYPTDLSSNNYGGNRVVFLINVVSNSKLRASSNGSDVYDIPAGEIANNAGRKIGARVQPLISNVENAIKEKSGAQVEIQPSVFNKRLKAAISLYVPNDLTFSYSASYGEEDLSTSENVASVFNDVSDGNLASIITGLGRKATSTFRSQGWVANAMQQTPGNAKVEQLFQGVDFRTFNFTYDFAPRSPAEARNVMNIISMFKHHMLPEYKDNDQFLFIFPSQFEIKYYTGSDENEFLDKHFTAVCTNCSINYTAAGQFSTFSDGMPTNIRMTLGFKELSIPTKETTPYAAMQKSYSEQKKIDTRNEESYANETNRKFSR